MLAWVRTSRAILRRDVRPFDMRERDGMSDDGVGLPGLCYSAKGLEYLRFRGRNDGGKKSGNAGGEQLARERDDDIGVNGIRIQVAATITIDLKIDETGRQPYTFLGGTGTDRSNLTIFHSDAEW